MVTRVCETDVWFSFILPPAATNLSKTSCVALSILIDAVCTLCLFAIVMRIASHVRSVVAIEWSLFADVHVLHNQYVSFGYGSVPWLHTGSAQGFV